VIEYYKENIQLYIVLIVWLLAGMFAGPAFYAVLALTLVLMKQKEMYEEMFIGYFFILVLSDSLEERLFFAKNAKNFYIVALAAFVFFDRKAFPQFNSLYKIFFPFFIFSVITMLTSVFEPFFFTSLQKTISYFITFLVIPTFISKLFNDWGTDFLKRFLFFAITILLIGFVMKFVMPEFASIMGGRYRGMLGNPNGLGTYCVLLFIIFFVINNFFPGLFSKNEAILAYSAILISVYMTGSRNAFLTVLIFLVFQRFFSISPLLGFILFVITLFVSEVVAVNAAQIIVSLGLGDYFRLSTIEDGSGRYIAWAFAWQQIQQNFFIGKGFAYNEYYMRQSYYELQRLGHQGGIHNSFLTFWMDQGLIGLLIYLRSYLIMFFKASKKTKFAFAIMFAIAFSAMFESWLVGSLSAFAFLSIFVFTLITSDEFIPSLETAPGN
jgi:O-antigen ligase